MHRFSPLERSEQMGRAKRRGENGSEGGTTGCLVTEASGPKREGEGEARSENEEEEQC